MNSDELTGDDLQFLRLFARALARGNHPRLHRQIRFELINAFDVAAEMAKREDNSNGE